MVDILGFKENSLLRTIMHFIFSVLFCWWVGCFTLIFIRLAFKKKKGLGVMVGVGSYYSGILFSHAMEHL